REVGCDVGVGEGREGGGEEAQLAEGSRLRDLHQAGVTGVRAPGRQRRLHECDDQREHKSEMSQLDYHCSPDTLAPTGFPLPAGGEGTGRGWRLTHCALGVTAVLALSM